MRQPRSTSRQLSTQGTRTLVLTATNSGSRALTVNVDGNRRKLAAGAHSQWTVRSVDGWYQAAVTVDEDPEFKRVLVGHIENGRTSVSQPT
ncbi:phospholipase domain-containing protein [Rhodococcus sp. 3.70]